MSEVLEAALRRHRWIMTVLLALLTLLAWAWLVAGAGMEMEAPPPGAREGLQMPGPMAQMTSPSVKTALLLFTMWFVMMIAMMVPSAAPTILLFGRASVSSGIDVPPTPSFLAGYLAAWSLFSLAATALQLLAAGLGLMSAMDMALRGDAAAAGILLATGAYQLSPFKHVCLAHCRSPAQWLSRHYRPGRRGAFLMGLGHGSYCVGCCWLLMALLFVGGVMNLAWIAIITLLVASEKILAFGRWVALAGGASFIIAGLLLLARG